MLATLTDTLYCFASGKMWVGRRTGLATNTFGRDLQEI